MKDKKSTIALVLSVVAIAMLTFVCATSKRAASEGENSKQLKSGRTLPIIFSPVLPDTLDFCGEAVPLDVYYVREGLDRELISFTYGHTSTMMCFKRAYRYFPIIEPILKKNGIPEDFKYLCVIESSLTNATSPAKAQGFWQFMKATGQTYNLEINDEIDMRNNIEASTEAACNFLKSLYSRLGSWTAAAASYNCGEGGLTRNMDKQSAKSYYHTKLNNETSRYVFRILAMKQVMQHPQDYGFYLRPCDLYPPIPTRNATLSGQNVDLYSFASKNGVSYKVFRELNPWITTEKLTNRANKSYTVKLPAESGISISKIRSSKDKSTEYISKI